jgi:hypothetical protein
MVNALGVISVGDFSLAVLQTAVRARESAGCLDAFGVELEDLD